MKIQRLDLDTYEYRQYGLNYCFTEEIYNEICKRLLCLEEEYNRELIPKDIIDLDKYKEECLNNNGHCLYYKINNGYISVSDFSFIYLDTDGLGDYVISKFSQFLCLLIKSLNLKITHRLLKADYEDEFPEIFN